jgi:hypothetical protein
VVSAGNAENGSRRDLTVRGVKAMLTRAGVDYSALTITHDPAVWTDLETGAQSTSIKIEGPEGATAGGLGRAVLPARAGMRAISRVRPVVAPVSDDRAAGEQARLSQTMAITVAESAVRSARMADLVEAQRAARARWSAAKGLLTKAMKDCSADKIAAAQKRERAAYAEFDRIGKEAIDEMLALNDAGLDNLGQVLDQMGRSWAADAAAIREPEAGR